MKSEIMAINAGNLPLHGTKLFVIMAISRSRGESMIRHPVTPAALHPNAMHIVRLCFPHALHFLKHLSKLNATRGRYPESSITVNRGKKIAIGGSITAAIQATTLYTPYTSISRSGAGTLIRKSPSISFPSRNAKRFRSNSEG